MSTTDTNFETRAEQTLAGLAEAIDDAVGDLLDVEFTSGILTIELESGGQYVINKHTASRQIWMSSPKSGALHFDHDETDQWVATSGAGTLVHILAEELSDETGVAVTLDQS